jgi:hypothetical protein
MMTPSPLVLVALAAVAVCGGVIAFVEGSTVPRIVYRSDTRVFYSPGEPTDAELAALTDSVALGTPPPSRFVLTSMEGRITGMITGELAGPPHEYSIQVLLVAPADSVSTATLYLGEQVLFTATILFTATRNSGAVVDRNGQALATMTALVPASGHFTVRVVWVGTDGRTRQDGLTF